MLVKPAGPPGDGAVRAIKLAVERKAMIENFDLQRAALVVASQDRPRPRLAGMLIDGADGASWRIIEITLKAER
jgi:hypothetical protein